MKTCLELGMAEDGSILQNTRGSQFQPWFESRVQDIENKEIIGILSKLFFEAIWNVWTQLDRSGKMNSFLYGTHITEMFK